MSRGGDCVKRSFAVKVVSVILVLLVAFSSVFVASAASESTSKIEKVTKTYDIAVVFDNSGSMYTLSDDKNNTRWCQAKYSMEIFASMLDYKGGDRLTIYTMWPVSVTGKSGKTSYKVEITSKDDIDKINKMYTVFDKNMGTPYKPVEEATAALKSSDSKYEKWLIVLTDGDFNYEDREQTVRFDAGKTVKSRLGAIAETGINVQFLGLDLITSDDSNISISNFYWDNATASNLKDKLIRVCNMIFQRHELDTDEYLDDDELDLEISMSKLIVFVQGNNKKSPVLKNSNGEVVPYYLDCGMRQYSEMKANEYDGAKAKVDKTLFGQVVTFENLPKGEYTLEYPGEKDKVKIFYEPDVTLFYELKDRDGEVATPGSKELYPGQYTVTYYVVDRVFPNENVTESPLMGENGVTDLNCVVEIVNGDNTTKVPVENEGSVELKPGDSVFLNINGTYLKNFKISTEDNKGSYTFNISQFPKPLELEVDAEVEQDGDWYQLSKKDEWKPIKVSIKYGDKALTDEEMAKVVPSFTFSPEVAYTYKMLPGESAYAVYIGKDKDGKDADVATGSYKITASAEFVDEYERTVKTEKPDEESFAVRTQSLPAVIIEILLLILLITAVILFIMSRKVLPKDLIADKREFKLRGRNAGDGNYNYDRKGKTLRLESPPVPTDMYAECKVTLSLYPVDRRWTPSRRRKVGIKDITSPSMGVVRVRIDGTAYEKMENGRFAQRLSPEDPIKEESVNPSIRIESKKNSVYDISLTSN